MARIIQTADLPENPGELDRNTRDWVYNGFDVCVTQEVLEAIAPQLDGVTGRTYEFSRALQAPILEMTMRGVLVDRARKAKVLAEFKADIKRLAHQLDRIVKEGLGLDLNWRSPKQLNVLLYDVLGLPVQRKRNANGQMSPTVDRDALEKLVHYYWAETICAHLLALRDLDKKRSFLETSTDPDGRMRTNYNIAGTNTGRLSSSASDFGTGTNLQNVDRKLRSVYVADKGMKFCNLDLEQADARNVGAICWNLFHDSHGADFAGAYLDACESGDLHTAVCRMAWADLDWGDNPSHFRDVADLIAYRQLSYRDLAKKLGHGTNYYGTPRTMAKHTHVAVPQIEQFQRRYFEGFPAIGSFDRNPHDPNWHNYVRKQLKDFGHITSQLGRRRYFFGRPTDDETIRAAIAYEPQSMTADEIDGGILALWRGHRVWLHLQVHDSILIQYPEEQEDEIVPWALETLKQRLRLKGGRDFFVPVEAKVGWNWGEVEYDGNGNVADNPDGLIKWKGHDSRKRTEAPKTTLSIRDL